MSSSASFYLDLSPLEYPGSLEEPLRLVELPDDWGLGVTDVVHSTRALEEGRYKEVNLVGAATIMAVLNVGGFHRLPYVFGGDGSLFAFPWSLRAEISKVLEETQVMARESFGLNLRAGVVPASAIREHGGVLRLGKSLLTPAIGQAFFWGNGWEMAETWLKGLDGPEAFQSLQGLEAKGNHFQGLECRWEQIPSSKEEVVVLIVRALATSEQGRAEIYLRVWQEIENIYGSLADHHPIDPHRMRLTLGQKELSGEWRVRSFNRRTLYRWWYYAQVRLLTMIGKFLMRKPPQADATGWGRYKIDAALQTDCRKFDNQIRQILAGSPAQRKKLVEFLEKLTGEGELLYGINVSGGTFMTCLISDHQKHHVHLIDGAEGGYALAAKEMKARQRKTEEAKSQPRA